MESNLETAFGGKSVGNRQSHLLAAAANVNVADTLIAVVVELESALLAMVWATELTGDVASPLYLTADCEKGVGNNS